MPTMSKRVRKNPPSPPATLVFHGLGMVKVKTVAVHPVMPWLLTSDDQGIVVHWDYKQSRIIRSVSRSWFKEKKGRGRKHRFVSLGYLSNKPSDLAVSALSLSDESRCCF